MNGFRTRDVLAGLVVLGIPAGATIWAAELASQPDWWLDGVPWWLAKLSLSVAWAVAGGVIVRDGLLQGARIDRLTEESRLKRNTLRTQALQDAYEGMLTADIRFPRKWEFTIYVYDEEEGLLVPSWPAPANDELGVLKSFKPGFGATGQAWESEALIVRIGPEVHDETYGLTPEQQAHFATRGTVVATPIWSDVDQKLGVLSAICDGEDEHFEKSANRSHLQLTASSVGALIVGLTPIE